MKYASLSILMLLMIVLGSSSVLGAICNETQIIVHDDETQASSDYNISIVRSCIPESSNGSFIVVGITFLILISLFSIIAAYLDNPLFKMIFILPVLISVIALLRYSTMFIEITNPEQTALIASLDTFYIILVSIIYPLIAIILFFVVLQIIGLIVNAAKGNGDDSYKPLGGFK